MSFITTYCRIKNYKITGGNTLLYGQASSGIDQFLDDAVKALSINYPKFYKMDRLSKLGFLGTEVLLRGTALVEAYGPKGVAIVLSNSHSSLDTDMRYFETVRTIASPALFVYTLTNIVTGEICIRHGFKGENAFFVSPAFDPQLIAGYVDGLLATSRTSACIAGWVDVMGDDHDVFLYLAENTERREAIRHSPDQLRELYLR